MLTYILFLGICLGTKIKSSWLVVTFVQGSSIELSADGPIKPPYAVYFQGGLTWYHAKLGILKSLQQLTDDGVVSPKSLVS